VSNIEPITGSSDAPVTPADVTLEPPIESSRVEREGLPRGYRMRADTHYVDHLGSQSAGQPVRMVPVDQIASPLSMDSQDLRLLTESIRTHGIVHPLLICRRDNGYTAIAGHKRLAAARLLRLPAVPCLLHHVDDTQAALLARADNLHTAAPPQHDATPAMAAAVRQAAAQSLGVVQASAALIATSPAHLARAAIDLVTAHAWRAAVLLEALDAATKPSAHPVRPRALASAIDQVVDGFAAEGRLSGVDVRGRAEGAAAGLAIDSHDVSLTLSIGVLALLPIVEHARVDRPAIIVTGSSGAGGAARFVITQNVAPVPHALAERFFDDAHSERAGGWCAVACALAVKARAERGGGTAAFDVDSQGHSSLTIQYPAGSSPI
jgi:ParB/RepB/Spo0J family partition protein